MGRKSLYRFGLMSIYTIVIILVIGNLRPEPNSSTIDKEKFWATKVHSKLNYEVIISGDSRVYRGIDPGALSATLNGLDVLNFGFSSGGHNKLIFKEIENRLRKNATTKIIILGLTPYSLTAKAQENSHYMQEKQRNAKEVFVRRYINPTLRFFDPMKLTDIIQKKDTANGYYERFRRHGWVESKKIPYNEKAALNSYVSNFKNNMIKNEVLKEVLSQVKIWTDQGIDVFALRMPTTREMEVLENELSGYNEEQLKLDIELAGGNWINYKNRFQYTSYDGSHLDGEAATKFSFYLGSEISKSLKK